MKVSWTEKDNKQSEHRREISRADSKKNWEQKLKIFCDILLVKVSCTIDLWKLAFNFIQLNLIFILLILFRHHVIILLSSKSYQFKYQLHIKISLRFRSHQYRNIFFLTNKELFRPDWNLQLIPQLTPKTSLCIKQKSHFKISKRATSDPHKKKSLP